MNKKFKCLVSVLMVAVLLGSVLTGCGISGDAGANADNNKPGNQVSVTINLTDYVTIHQYAQDDGTIRVRAIVNTTDLAKKLLVYTVGWYDLKTLTKTLEGKDNHDIHMYDLGYEGEGYFDDLNNQVEGCKVGDVVKFIAVVNERGLNLLKAQVPGVTFVWEESIEHTVTAQKSN